MHTFERITTWLHIVVASMAALTADFFQDAMAGSDMEKWYMVAPVIVAIVGMNVTNWVAISTINRARWLRRLLAGRNDIEGDWVNIVIDTEDDSGKVLFAEFTKVWYDSGQYVISGDTWTLDGTWRGSFKSEASTYKDLKLEYFYKAGLRGGVGGYGVVQFFPKDSLPTDFVCHYLDEESASIHLTRGRRLKEKLSTSDVDMRRDKALEFAKSFDTDKLLDPKSVSSGSPRRNKDNRDDVTS